MDILIVIIGIAYLGFTVYLANTLQQKQVTTAQMDRTALRWLLYLAGGLTALMSLSLLTAIPTSTEVLPETRAILNSPYGSHQDRYLTPSDDLVIVQNFVYQISTSDAVIGLSFTLTSTLLIFYLVSSSKPRRFISRFIHPKRRYDPDSLVHLTAIVLSLMIISSLIATFLLAGGSDALAEDLQDINLFEALFQNVLWVFITLLGVGFAIRRNRIKTLYRLGLRVPTKDDWLWGISAGFGLIILIIIIGIILTLIFGDIGTEASSNQVEALARLGPIAIILLMISVAVGEELFFRGAFQPVFGNGLTTAFFITLHIQSLFDPSILGLVAVSLILGWVRDRQSTIAAIFAHLTYNLIIVGLQILAESST